MFKKYIASLLLVVMFLSCAALGEGMISFDRYAASLSALTDAQWQEDGCADILSLSADDSFTIGVCLSRGEVVAVTVETLQGGELNDIAYAALEALGCLDEDALAVLTELDDGAQAVSGDCVFGRLAGEKREGIYVCAEADYDQLVWQPVHGGEKYHRLPTCAGMDVPRLVTREAAVEAGYDPCGKCKP